MTFFTSLLFIGAAGATFYSFARLDEIDLPKYQTLIRESVELRSKSALEREPAHQFRTEVQKDIWTLNNQQRLHSRLKSQGSDLTIRQIKGKIEASEQLKEVECCMQEEIEGENQQIRYLFTPEGTYLFPSHRFAAEEVDLYFFSLPGAELPASWPTEPSFLRGTAHNVAFSAKEGFPSFTAYHLNAEFDPTPTTIPRQEP